MTMRKKSPSHCCQCSNYFVDLFTEKPPAERKKDKQALQAAYDADPKKKMGGSGNSGNRVT